MRGNATRDLELASTGRTAASDGKQATPVGSCGGAWKMHENVSMCDGRAVDAERRMLFDPSRG